MPGPVDTRVRANAFGCITVPFLLVAIIPLAWGARASWQDGQLARTGHVVQGQVIELRHVASNGSVVRQSSRGGQARGVSPIVAFTTRTGEHRIATGSVNRQPALWAVGQAVAIVYDPSDPGRADLLAEVGGWRRWFAIWCAVALVPLAIASLPVVMLIRQRRAPLAPGG